MKTHEECMQELRKIPLRNKRETERKVKEYKRRHLPPTVVKLGYGK